MVELNPEHQQVAEEARAKVIDYINRAKVVMAVVLTSNEQDND